MMMQGWKMSKTELVSKKIQHNFRHFGVVSAIAILVAYTGDVWGNLARLWLEFSHVLEKMYQGSQKCQ